MAEDCGQAKNVAVALEQPRIIRFAQARHRLNEGIEHRLQVECRPADDLEHVGGDGLLLERFGQIGCALPQLVEESCVLDSNDRLDGKVLDQLDLFVRERPHLGTIDKKRANQLLPFEQRHPD